MKVLVCSSKEKAPVEGFTEYCVDDGYIDVRIGGWLVLAPLYWPACAAAAHRRSHGTPQAAGGAGPLWFVPVAAQTRPRAHTGGKTPVDIKHLVGSPLGVSSSFETS